jgi:uncharacterized protein YggE
MRHAMVLVAVLVAGCAVPGAVERPPRLLTAVGEGRVRVEPDLAVVRVGAEARAARLADATTDVTTRIGAVLARLKTMGIEERRMRTVQYSIDPVFAAPRAGEEAARIAGYRVLNVVQVEVPDVRGVGPLVDAAVAAGANTVPSLTFTLAQPERAEAEARARAIAAADAKARQMASAAGVLLGELVALGEGTLRPVERTAQRSMAVATPGPGPVEPGQLEVVVTVEARYRIR